MDFIWTIDNKIWLMQAGERSHQTDKIFNLLEEHYGTQIIILDYKVQILNIDWLPYLRHELVLFFWDIY